MLSGGKFDEGVTSCFSFTLSRVHNIKEKLLDAIILGMFLGDEHISFAVAFCRL